MQRCSQILCASGCSVRFRESRHLFVLDTWMQLFISQLIDNLRNLRLWA